ncbi:MAG: hypothetical protein ACJ760_10840 [Thermoleophilaceae bacterium]
MQVAPSSSSDNVIQATGDYTELVLRRPSSGSSQNLLEIQDSGGSVLSGIGPDGRFGIGAPPGSNQLTVVEQGSGWAANIRAAKSGLTVRHIADLQGEAIDLVNFFHKGTGDACYIDHTGGTPPGSNIVAGGNAAFNALIPLYTDHHGLGTDGTILNDRTGMKGMQIYTQAPNDNVIGIAMHHSGKSYGLYLRNQDPAFPQGHGPGIHVDSWSNSAALRVYARGGSGNTLTLGNDTADTFTVSRPGGAFIQPTDGTVIPLRVRGAAGQSTSLQEWQQSDGSPVLKVTKSSGDSGTLRFKSGSYLREQTLAEGGQDRLFLRSAAANSRIDVIDQSETFFMMQMRLGDFRLYPGDSNNVVFNVLGPRTGLGVAPSTGRLTATAPAASESVAIFKGAASQGADLQQWQSSAGDVLSTITENGYFTTRKNTAPGDGEIAPGEMALWFDSSNGQAKLMVKARQANGTIRTGSVALS